MRIYRFLAPIIILLCLSVIAAAQNATVKGRVVDHQENMPLPGAHVSLQNEELLKEDVTGESGFFAFDDIPPGNYSLKITFLGFEEKIQSVRIESREVNLGDIRLTPAALQLEEIEVKETVIPVTQSGDTTRFNADAFKTNPDANAEDLVRKMPGISVENGKVQAQGEDVKEVLVDGKPFFGSDPMAALRNLPADVIEKIEVFDQKSEQARFSGFDDGETSKTINIVMRPGMKDGQFGRAASGIGTEGKYLASGSYNVFDGDRRVTLLGLANNINQQNFSGEDLAGVASPGRGGGRRGGGGRGGPGGRFGGGSSEGDFLVGQQDGISKIYSGGINYQDTWGEKLEVSGSYFFNRSDNEAQQFLTRDFVVNSEGTNRLYSENTSSFSRNTNHRLNLKLDYKINERNSLLFQPRFSFQETEGEETTLATTLENGVALSTTDYHFQPVLSALDASGLLLYRHRFLKEGRTFSLSLNGGMTGSQGKSFLLSENIYFDEDDMSDTLDQYNDLEAEGFSLSSDINYTEPIGEKSQLQLNFGYSVKEDDSEKETFDFEEVTGEYTELNTLSSNCFSSTYTTQSAGLGYRFRDDKLSLNARLNFQQAILQNDQLYPFVSDIHRTFFSALPSVFLRYNISKRENIRLAYRTRNSPPSVRQLQEVIDNSNPLQLSSGNPDLVQDFQHNLFARYSTTNTEKSSTFFALLAGSYTDNYIANSTITADGDTTLDNGIILHAGEQFTYPVNLDHNWSLRGFVTYGMPVKQLKSNINLNLSANFTQRPGLVNGALNFSRNTAVGAGIVLSSNISENVDFTISSRSEYNYSANSLDAENISRYFNQNSEARINLLFGNGFVFRTSISNRLYSGLSGDFDTNYWLWNAEIGKKLFKDHSAEITLSVFDLLKQNTSIQQTVTETYIENIQTRVLQQFFMLTFQYKLNHFKE